MVGETRAGIMVKMGMWTARETGMMMLADARQVLQPIHDATCRIEEETCWGARFNV